MTGRYAHPLIAAQFTDEAVLASWLAVWGVTLEVIARPISPLDRQFDTRHLLGRSRQLEEVYGHDVAAACEALREALRGIGEPANTEAARWLHYGLCSSDVVDAGLFIRLLTVEGLIGRLANKAGTAVNRIGDDLQRSVYRTHGQDAVVAPAVYRWVRAATEFAADREPLVVTVGFNGPTGTGGPLSPSREAIAAALGFGEPQPNPPGSQHARRSVTVLPWLEGLARLAGACESFGTDVRLLAASGVGEVREGRGAEYRGSSSMPHKFNPTRSERLCGLAPVVRGLVNGYREAVSSNWDAHSLEHSAADRVVIPQVCELVGFMLTEVTDIAHGLKIDHSAMERNVARAPADSFVARNRAIEAGEDGGEAYERLRGVAVDNLWVDSLEMTRRVGQATAEFEALTGDAHQPQVEQPLGTPAVDEWDFGDPVSPAAEGTPIGVTVSATVTDDASSDCQCGHRREMHGRGVGQCMGEYCTCGVYIRAKD